jgi:type IV secretory pathway TraG/TraD family ATPase VirD4
MVVGATGSGKTLMIKMLMQSALAPDRIGENTRALVYDAKQDVVSTLVSICKRWPIILNPLDANCHAWDMASDIDSPVSARQLAAILVPDDQAVSANESFFTSATRDLIAGVVVALIARRKVTEGKCRWDLRDILNILLNAGTTDGFQDLNFLFQRSEHSGSLKRLMAYFAEPRLKANVVATINSKLTAFEPIAAAWDHAATVEGRSISLREWLRSKDVMVLGNEETARESIDTINRVIMRRVSELILAQPEVSPSDMAAGSGRTWVFLDEVREAGKLDGLSRLLTKGRSKGACVVLGFQDIDGLRDVYGENVANEIVGQCNHIAILRLRSPETAMWASELFGEFRSKEVGSSMTYSKESSISRDVRQQVVKAVYSGMLLHLPRTTKETGITGFFDSPFSGQDPATEVSDVDARHHIDPWSLDEDDRPRLPKEGDHRQNFTPRPVEHQFLHPMNQSDRTRLGLSAEESLTAEKEEAVAAAILRHKKLPNME